MAKKPEAAAKLVRYRVEGKCFVGGSLRAPGTEASPAYAWGIPGLESEHLVLDDDPTATPVVPPSVDTVTLKPLTSAEKAMVPHKP